jgi:hypothetical protein
MIAKILEKVTGKEDLERVAYKEDLEVRPPFLRPTRLPSLGR